MNRYYPSPNLYLNTALLTILFLSLFSQDSLAKASLSQSAAAGQINSEAASSASQDTRDRLEQIEERRRDLHERASLVRKKEQIALIQLSRIENKLSMTKGALKTSKRKLENTEDKISEVQETLSQVKTDEESLTEQAAQRLREIYEGQRLNFIEMLLQINSLQTLLDKLFYQEKIAVLDRNLLEDMRRKEVVLAQNKDKLGKQKNELGDIVSNIAKQAMAIAKEKFDQQQTANRLKTQRAFYEQAEKQLANESHQLETQILQMETTQRNRNQHLFMGSGTLSAPLKADITSPFGWRKHPIFGIRRFHTGIDLAGPNHASIRAADSGNVLYTGWYGGYGKVVIVSHGKGMATLYAHLSKVATTTGTNIAKGDIIGYEGTTGFSTGPHLHFEVRINGKPNNPIAYLR
jgi:murein DD-endopeptidase MepM/ murein hydrolase activator NlpD